jgi:hypothetical protein
MQLDTIANISSGYHFRGAVRDYPRGPLPVLQVGDFDDDLRFDQSKVQRIEPNFDPNPQTLRNSDVLFLARGHRHWAVTANGAAGMVVPGYFYILRPDESRVLPHYLSWWLNHPRIRTRIDGLQRGSNIPFVPLTEFRSLPIPVPPLAVQHRLVAVSDLAERERELCTRLQSLQDLLLLGIAEQEPAPGRNSRSR